MLNFDFLEKGLGIAPPPPSLSSPLIFGSFPFRLPYLFLNFDYLPVNSDLKSSKKELCPHNTPTQNS